jgi:tRNA(fMet)-specific endonuclease VapC
MYIFDSDHVGIIQWQSEPEYSRLMQRISHHAAGDFFVTIVSFHEEILGWNAYIAKAKQIQGVIKGYDRLLHILTDFSEAQVLPFDDAAAAQFVHLQQQRVRVSTMDLRIASIALSHSMTVLTRNLSDFRRVPSLNVEDWTT